MNAQIRSQVVSAVQACEEKKGEDISILEMDKNSSAFTDYFLICTGRNPRQIQAIADEVELRLKKSGVPANQVEGYNQADWILIDYLDFVVHIFSEASRKFYDLKKPAATPRSAKFSRTKAPAKVGSRTHGAGAPKSARVTAHRRKSS